VKDKTLKLTLALCVIVVLGAVAFHSYTRRPKGQSIQTPTVSFLDDMSATNARMAAELDTEQKGLGDAGRESAYREWRKRYDEAVRAVYARHGRELPNHLKVK
jgi:hypothetical protein